LLCCSASAGFAAGVDKTVSVDIVKDGSSSGTVDMALINKMGYLKARDVSDIFGFSIDYDNDTGRLCMKRQPADDRPSGEIVFKIGSEYVVMNGIKRKMMKVPLIIKGRAYIPLEAVITRAFEAVVGAQIYWNFQDRTLWISYKGNVADIRSYTYDDYTRFVIELTKDMEYESESEPRLIKISVKDGKLALPAEKYDIRDTIIDGVEISRTAGSLDFIIKLSEKAGNFKIDKLPSPPRIVVDIENSTPAAENIRTEQDIEKLPPAPAGPAKRDKVAIDNIKLVVIDPGHGGKDPGAVGPHGTREKDITLAIAQKLSVLIRSKLRIRTVLTRTHDYFVPLEKRTEIANSKDADVFISIHTNASLNPDSSGFEVYFLSDSASDKEAQAVANLENSVMAMESAWQSKDKVSRILWSLTMNQFMNESSELCSFVSSNVVSCTGFMNRGVKQAGFYVMRGARMPAILVEVGFISNRKEERLLSSEKFQKKVAEAICEALGEYRKWIKNR